MRYIVLVRILKVKKPAVVFLENVKNLVSHDKGNTFKVILDELHSLGYKVRKEVLNAKDYGDVPQNRERIYIVGFLDENACNRFEFPKQIPLTKELSDIIDFTNKKDDKYYYTQGKYKGDIMFA